MHKTASAIADDVLLRVKAAGLKEFARYALTGRSTGYHGTSARASELIRSEGLIPRKSPGVVDAIKAVSDDPTEGQNLAFIARNRGIANTYAGQQGFIEAAGTTPGLLGNNLSFELVGDGSVGSKVNTTLRAVHKSLLGALNAGIATNKGPLKLQYPARNFDLLRNPEIDVMAQKYTAAGVPSPVAKTLSNVPFIGTYGLKPVGPGQAAMPAEYIAGSPKYQHTSLPEVRAHLEDVRAYPKRNALEAFRNLIGF